ncbi:hypothetical protein [Bacillus sp. FSL K6-1284]|uniref:hypothetical protein n=1 Tax=Bacillus sp. FSL K6-1284 TaxID=2921468 RepID=UPI0030FC0E00
MAKTKKYVRNTHSKKVYEILHDIPESSCFLVSDGNYIFLYPKEFTEPIDDSRTEVGE